MKRREAQQLRCFSCLLLLRAVHQMELVHMSIMCFLYRRHYCFDFLSYHLVASRPLSQRAICLCFWCSFLSLRKSSHFLTWSHLLPSFYLIRYFLLKFIALECAISSLAQLLNYIVLEALVVPQYSRLSHFGIYWDPWERLILLRSTIVRRAHQLSEWFTSSDTS